MIAVVNDDGCKKVKAFKVKAKHIYNIPESLQKLPKVQDS